jgi:hypothetical protein
MDPEFFQYRPGFDWTGFAAFITAAGVLLMQIWDRRDKKKRERREVKRDIKVQKIAEAVGADKDGDGKPDV